MLKVTKHIIRWLAAYHVSLVHDHQLKVPESLVPRLTATLCQQRLLTCHNHLAGVILFRVEVSHLHIRILLCDVPHLLNRLPDKLTHRADDQRPSRYPCSQCHKDHGLASTREQAVERGGNTTIHGLEVGAHDLFLVVAELHKKKPGGEEGRGLPRPRGAVQKEANSSWGSERFPAPNSVRVRTFSTILVFFCPSFSQDC